VLIAGSSGGHLAEALQVASLLGKYKLVMVTEDEPASRSAVAGKRAYLLKQVNRRMLSLPFLMLYNTFKSARILIRERPQAVITLGALATVPLCFLAKIGGAKVVVIESFARTSTLSLTTRIVAPIADLVLVQWPALQGAIKGAQFGGTVF
jgi:UDP-N-acetylglucosamine:LPS N-acetylglucosamine transferase